MAAARRTKRKAVDDTPQTFDEWWTWWTTKAPKRLLYDAANDMVFRGGPPLLSSWSRDAVVKRWEIQKDLIRQNEHVFVAMVAEYYKQHTAKRADSRRTAVLKSALTGWKHAQFLAFKQWYNTPRSIPAVARWSDPTRPNEAIAVESKAFDTAVVPLEINQDPKRNEFSMIWMTRHDETPMVFRHRYHLPTDRSKGWRGGDYQWSLALFMCPNPRLYAAVRLRAWDHYVASHVEPVVDVLLPAVLAQMILAYYGKRKTDGWADVYPNPSETTEL